jgi:3-methyladenine DNA glycosylase AlkD
LARTCHGLSLEDLDCLLKSHWHEERLLALVILVARHRKSFLEDQKTLCRFYLSRTSSINNWDLVDISAGQIVGGTLDPNHIDELERLAHSTCLWERRIAIIATSFWIRQAIVSPTLHIAGLLVADPHDLIHKAVGWMLREVGKKDMAALHDFLDRYLVTLPRTMLRYAIERFPEPLRQHYLRARFR